jgi:hypothetical protein
MPRLLASLLALIALLASAACGRGKLGIVIEQDGTVNTAAITRLHLKVSETEILGPNQWRPVAYEVIIDREHGWDGNLPTSLIYEGWVGDADKYHATVAAYEGDQIVAQSNGSEGRPGWFQNVDRVVYLELESKVPIWPHP